jgi:hypothetical protein
LEVESGGSWLWGWLGLHIKTLSQKNKTKQKVKKKKISFSSYCHHTIYMYFIYSALHLMTINYL